MIKRRGDGEPVTKELFLSWLDRSSSDCWIWQRAIQNGGYGFLVTKDGARRSAHRFAYTLFIAPIPPGKFVLHHCDNRLCCNPEHLFLGSHAINVKRRARGESHGNARLTQADVDAIRADTRTQKEIAYDYGVTRDHIGKILRGVLWAPPRTE